MVSTVLSLYIKLPTKLNGGYRVQTFLSDYNLLYTLYIGITFFAGMEIVGPSWRVFTGLMVMEAWAVGFVILAGIAYGIRDWFVLQLVITAPISILSIYFWYNIVDDIFGVYNSKVQIF